MDNPRLQPPTRRSLVSSTDIFLALVSKELHVKYKRSVLGFFWSLATPLALAAVYLFVFVHVYRVPQEDFALFLLTGLLPWQFFQMATVAATNSLVDNAPLIRKVYFPRPLLPIGAVAANLVTFMGGLGVLMLILLATGRPLWLGLHWLVVALVLQTALCVGISLALSVWNVYFRDIAQVIGIFLLVLFFLTPIVYDVTMVPAAFRALAWVNPLAPIMETYRAALFEVRTPDLGLLAAGAAEAAGALALGYLVFRRLSPRIPKEL
ncbi:MAG TPA: ABC transporter permease [Actinomycetota bacterium]|nr:ABC transporter permease [Actinomycetota bacterium]